MAWKFLREGMRSENGEHTWEIGRWYEAAGPLELCVNGFHCSRRILDAMRFVQGEILAEVEVRGEALAGGDKSCHRSMRVIRAWKFQRRDWLELAIYSAELVLPIWEQEYPDDSRPRQAIDAAKAVLASDTPETRAAANAAANAAGAAANAANAAWAAWAAWAAANAANAAGAAWAAGDAARAAGAAAGDAARAAGNGKKIEKRLRARIKTLEAV
jgi:hypothetical protein